MKKELLLESLVLIWGILVYIVESIIVYKTGIRHQKRLNKRIQRKFLPKKAFNSGINILNEYKTYRCIPKKTLSNIQLNPVISLKNIKYKLHAYFADKN